MGFPNDGTPPPDLVDFLLRTFLQMPSWCAVP